MKKQSSDADFRIGSPDAWDPSERAALLAHFLPTEQFSGIAREGMSFLCGGRGSGKSAIALMLGFGREYHYTEVVPGEASEYGAYMDVASELAKRRDAGEPIDIKQAVRRLWSWVLPVKAMQTVYSEAKREGRESDTEIRIIGAYLASLPAPLHQDSRIGDLLYTAFSEALRLLDKGRGEFSTYLLNLTGASSFRSALDAASDETRKRRLLLVFDTLESYRVFRPYMVEGLQGVLARLSHFSNTEVHFCVPKCPRPT